MALARVHVQRGRATFWPGVKHHETIGARQDMILAGTFVEQSWAPLEQSRGRGGHARILDASNGHAPTNNYLRCNGQRHGPSLFTTRIQIYPIMSRLFATLIIGLLLTCSAVAGTALPKSGKSLFDRWANNETLSIELHINMDSLEAYRKKADYLPAAVIAGGQELDLEVAVRGRFRRRTCAMPPLKLKFAKEGLRDHGLNTHNDFKLVTHCTDDKAGMDAILREQLAYELYRTINPEASFRTQLLEVTYVNTVDGSRTKNVAIMIEDYDELQDRLELDGCKECYGSTTEQVDNLAEVTLFQYMIGNADFDVKMVRNTKLLVDETGRRTAVPYDFDFSGLTDASYATPLAGLGQVKVTDRVLVETCEGEVIDYTEAIADFQAKQTTLLGQVDAFPGLSKKSKKQVTKYLQGFFAELDAGFMGPAK